MGGKESKNMGRMAGRLLFALPWTGSRRLHMLLPGHAEMKAASPAPKLVIMGRVAPGSREVRST